MSEVIDRAVQQLGYTATKEHQRTVVEGLVGGKDVFGILPTGYGNGAGRPLVRVLYAEATRPFPVNAKGAGPQTSAHLCISVRGSVQRHQLTAGGE